MLVGARRIRAGFIEFESSEPLDMDTSVTTTSIAMQFASPKAATLSIRQLYAPRSLVGVSKNDWTYDAQAQLLTLKLSPQTTSIRILPAGTINLESLIKL